MRLFLGALNLGLRSSETGGMVENYSSLHVGSMPEAFLLLILLLYLVACPVLD